MKFFYLLLVLLVISLSLSLTGCFQWAARAESKLPKETALHKSYSYDGKVIIVGAGAAGLAAAKVLEQNKVDYVILEATNRYGGRLKKDTTLADFSIDIGAEWLHSAPITLNKLKGKKGSEIDEELIPYHLDNTANWDGKKYKAVSNSQNNFMYNFMPESKFKSTTWYDFVVEHIAKTVKHKIKYNSPVSAIDYSNNKIILTTRYGDVYEADRVLVTVSIGVLKSNMIKFTPDLNEDRKQALNDITFHQGIKVALKFSEKFYPDAVACKVKSGGKVFYDIAFKKDTQTKVLGFLCTGDETQKYYDLNSEEEIISSLLHELDQMFDGKATTSYTGEYVLENWGQYEYTQGTWIQAFQEKQSDIRLISQALDNKVYFAGEVYDTYQQMGVPGAILSGYHAVDEILE